MPEFEVRELRQLLSGAFGDDFEILAQRSKLLTPPGEHYGSIMLALDVDILKGGKNQTLNLVAKLLPASEMLRAAFDTGITFKKEVAAYTKTIPALIRFQKDFSVPNEKILDIFAKCYGARVSLKGEEVDDDAVLIFENLKIQGYDTGDRFVGFDYLHTKMIVKDLAKFHAVTIALKILRPDEFKEFVDPSIVANYGMETLPEDVASAFVDSILETAKTIPEIQPYLEKVNKIVLESDQDLKNKNLSGLISPYTTAVHADYWVNNTMILQDPNGKPLKNKIVDLQIMQYDSSVRDLIFFLFTSVIDEVLDVHYEDFISFYHETFVDYLKDFKVDLEPFSWENFLLEVEDVGPKEFHHVAFMLKPIFTEKGSVKSLTDFEPSDWSRRDLIGPAHRNKLKQTVLAFAKRNWL